MDKDGTYNWNGYLTTDYLTIDIHIIRRIEHETREQLSQRIYVLV